MKLSKMKEACGRYNIKTLKKDDIDSLKEKLIAHFLEKNIGLDVACSACKNDIPDINICPWCGVEFEEEEKVEPPKKKADTKDKSKKPDSKDSKKSKPKSKTAEVIRDNKGYINIHHLADAIQPLIEKEGLKKIECKTYITYVVTQEKGWDNRVFLLLRSKWYYMIQIAVLNFVPPIPARYEVFSDDKIKSNRKGSSRGVYRTPFLEEAVKAIEVAIKLAKKGELHIRTGKKKKEDKGKEAKKKSDNKKENKKAEKSKDNKTAKKKTKNKGVKKSSKKKATKKK